MLPAHLADNIRKQVLFYLQSTFDFRDKEVERAFTTFLNDPDTGLFKGPWVHNCAGRFARRRRARPRPSALTCHFTPSGTRIVPGDG